MSYAKSHLFGYRPVKERNLRYHSYEQVQRIQTVHMIDENGFHQVRTIKHYDVHQRGKTFAEMFYETFFAVRKKK